MPDSIPFSFRKTGLAKGRGMKNLVSAIYYHPEAYPPTLNAIGQLSTVFDQIEIVHRPHLQGSWTYPGNVVTIPSGRLMSSQQQQDSGKGRKAWMFLRFVKDFWASCKRLQPSVILVYDTHALFAYSLVRKWLKPHILWYHSHDISEIHRESKYSIGWFACKAEKKIFADIDVFTLPTEERFKYFAMEAFNGKAFVIPNYPSRSFYGNFASQEKDSSSLKVIFQGRVGEDHGIEAMIPLLGSRMNGRIFRLVLKGHCSDSYKEKIMMMAGEKGRPFLEFIGYTAYREVPVAASRCHFGNAIFAKEDVMNSTLGTASNKIYEYAALGLPVLYLAGSAVGNVVGKYKWAIPVTLNIEDIRESISSALDSYDELSGLATADFEHSLNFETVFRPALEYINKLLQAKN